MEKLAIIGLGYVGLPLAVEFGKTREVVGFDISEERIVELMGGIDRTKECSADELSSARHLTFSAKVEDLTECSIFIITVPTPVDGSKRPNLTPLIKASETVGQILKVGDIVIYESTVFPGATEDVCVPILQRESGLEYNQDFFCGYSPERINPGDREHRLTTITKITSGSTQESAQTVDRLYASIIKAGTHLVSSIRVAEAAKVIENTQRDVNIALMNELSVIFSRLQINTSEVLEAAGTKWNFMPFRPGLVGGHCIGVDPYYLTYKAQQAGYHPEIILAGRRINDSMALHVANRVIKLFVNRGVAISGSRILILGATFKPNCPDIRNSKVLDLINELTTFGVLVEIYEPWVEREETEQRFGVPSITNPQPGFYDGMIVAVGHEQFKSAGFEKLREWGKPECVLFDVMSIFPTDKVDGQL